MKPFFGVAINHSMCSMSVYPILKMLRMDHFAEQLQRR